MIHNLGRFIYLIRCRIRQNIKTITKESQDYILVRFVPLVIDHNPGYKS